MASELPATSATSWALAHWCDRQKLRMSSSLRKNRTRLPGQQAAGAPESTTMTGTSAPGPHGSRTPGSQHWSLEPPVNELPFETSAHSNALPVLRLLRLSWSVIVFVFWSHHRCFCCCRCITISITSWFFYHTVVTATCHTIHIITD